MTVTYNTPMTRRRPLRAKTILLLTVLLLVTGCSGAGTPASPTVPPEPTVTRVPSVTFTYTPPVTTATSFQPVTPTPRTNDIYYMIVLDASAGMKESFGGVTKWDAARATVEAILRGLEPGANYNLVVIGASSQTKGLDLCNEPSVVRTPFSFQRNVLSQIGQLQPAGGGSTLTAFNLALEQFNGLPPHAIRVLIHIGGSDDDCARDEWRDLESLYQRRGAVDAGLYGEIIILDADEAFNGRTVAGRLSGLSRNVNAQALQSFGEIQQIVDAVIGNITNHIASVPTVTPPPTSTSFLTLTPVPILSATATLSPAPSTVTTTSTLTPSPAPPTITSTSTLTRTPSATPSSTQVLPPSVTLLSVNYLTAGTGCQIDVQVRVNGSDATGRFHVWNSSLPSDGDVYPQTTLQVGTHWGSAFSLNNLLTLGGDTPASQRHEVWFEYNGVQSNRLKDLLCPLPIP